VTEREELVTKLRAIATERTDDKIYLRADGTVPYSDVAEVMGALSAAGFSDIALVTETGGPRLDPQGG
ncbi:MAG: biopolymer transporter ExbD, partial [Pseudomonadota bacterium]